MFRFTIAVVCVTFQISLFCDAKPSTTALMPEGCRGKNYCFKKHQDYPEATIQALLKDVDKLFQETDGNLSTRTTTDDQESLPCDCETNISMQPIYEIIDDDDNLRYVAQSDKKFRQMIRIEECVNPGRIQGGTYNFPRILLEYVNISCVETKIPYQFIVLSLDGKSMESVSVKGGVSVSCNTRLEE